MSLEEFAKTLSESNRLFDVMQKSIQEFNSQLDAGSKAIEAIAAQHRDAIAAMKRMKDFGSALDQNAENDRLIREFIETMKKFFERLK